MGIILENIIPERDQFFFIREINSIGKKLKAVKELALFLSLASQEFDVLEKIIQCQLITKFSIGLHGSISVLPLFRRKAVEVCDTEQKHFQANQEILRLLCPQLCVVTPYVRRRFANAGSQNGNCKALPEGQKHYVNRNMAMREGSE